MALNFVKLDIRLKSNFTINFKFLGLTILDAVAFRLVVIITTAIAVPIPGDRRAEKLSSPKQDQSFVDFFKISVLINFPNLTGKHLCWVSF